MPTIFHHRGLRYQIYSQDHPPRHVHAKGAGCEARVLLDEPIAVTRSAGFTPRQLSRIVEVVRSRADELKDAWHGLFGKPER